MPRDICAQEGCEKKLALTSIQCKCEKKFCNTHRYPEDHACTFDFKSDGKKELLKYMSTSVTFKKVEAI
jgi:predicted nucleic acid binding AN1-type Zn finger protein